jgi:hypothetical protein
VAICYYVPRGVMQTEFRGCGASAAEFTETERLHAAMAYKRPPGNLDPDRDPPSYAALTTDDSPRVVCRAAGRPH